MKSQAAFLESTRISHSGREVLTSVDFDYIVAESRHPHALHQNALYMALSRGNVEMADIILSSIVLRLEELRYNFACTICDFNADFHSQYNKIFSRRKL